MKKLGLFVGLLLLASFFSFIISVSAQNESTGLEGVPLVNELQSGQQQYEQYTSAENKSEYLTQEWVKLLEKHKYLGPVVKVLNPILKFMSPFFKMILGYEATLSWAFFFAIVIWFGFFFFLNPITSELLNSGALGGIAAFVTASLIGLSGAIKFAVNWLVALISNIWIAVIAFVVALLLVFVFGKLGKMIKAKWQKWKEKTKKESMERKVETLEEEERARKEEWGGGY